jgi:hypothetical protein
MGSTSTTTATSDTENTATADYVTTTPDTAIEIENTTTTTENNHNESVNDNDITDTTTAVTTIFVDATASPESAMSKLNHILQLQDNIKTECNSILELQSKTIDDLKLYVEHQTMLNGLFLQHMELGLRVTGILTTESLKSADVPPTLSTQSSFGCCDDSVDLTARDAVPYLGRTLSVMEGNDIKLEEP